MMSLVKPTVAPPSSTRTGLFLAAVTFSLLSAMIILPRPTRPRWLPLPVVSSEALSRADEHSQALAQSAQATALPVSTRTVGELYRRLNLALLESGKSAKVVREDLRLVTQTEIKAGRTHELLTLRALQSELFLSEVHRFERTGQVSPELTELAADIGKKMAQYWQTPSGKLTLSDADLRLLFRVRWGQLTGTHRLQPFGPSLEEFKGYFSIYLRPGPEAALAAAERSNTVRALGKMDRSYPSEFALGVLALDAGDFSSAESRFSSFLQSTQSGPYSHLAENHLLFAKSRLANSQ